MGHTPHLYLPGPWDSVELSLGESHLHHLSRVLRLHDGSPVTYTDGVGGLGEGVWQSGGVVRGSERVEAAPEPSISVAVAPPRKARRLRFVVEKLVELGVDRLIWLETRFGEGRPPRQEKAAAWAIAGLEQSPGVSLAPVRGPGPAWGPANSHTLGGRTRKDSTTEGG